jgi:hypothetical protein
VLKLDSIQLPIDLGILTGEPGLAQYHIVTVQGQDIQSYCVPVVPNLEVRAQQQLAVRHAAVGESDRGGGGGGLGGEPLLLHQGC